MIFYCTMDSPFLKHLNQEQREAIVETDGPVLILAGAGSGKTRVLTHKVAYLITEKNISPGNILMVTFTNKAAGEMKERIRRLLTINPSTSFRAGNQQSTINLPFAGTFHSLCVRILRRHGEIISIASNFLIYDEDDTKSAIKEVVEKLKLDKKKFNPGKVAYLISQAKNELLTPATYSEIARGDFQEVVALIFREYQKLLSKNNALGFDDLLSSTVDLFIKDKDTASYYQDKFRYVLVDEYQDTNHAQYELSKLLSLKWQNITVVGDASQSIYSWRGADFRNILNFKKDFPQVRIFHLEKNYRSTQIILDAAYHVISKNQTHPILKLEAKKDGGSPIILFQARNEYKEAEFIVGQIINGQSVYPDLKYSDFAVLYRTNAQSRNIEEVFLQNGIPYVLVGGVRFYERKEIKDILSYLRLLINPNDSVSKNRTIKIGKTRFTKFLEFANKYLERSYSENLTTLEIMDHVIKTTSYLDLFDKEDEDDLERLENIAELKSVASRFPNLFEFIETVTLLEGEPQPTNNTGFDKRKDAVYLMTLHAAKGLEFRHVFIIGMEEGLFPHGRSLMDNFELEEERRLCYVGITRAMDRLYLTYTKNRLYFGERSESTISRFLMEIPDHLISATDNFS